MGESKRRRQLDPNYGQPQVPDDFKDIFGAFISKEIDIAIMSPKYLVKSWPDKFAHLKPKNAGLKKHQSAIVPVSPLNNFARGLFLECQQEIMTPTIPLIQEHGRGWISQLNDPRKCGIGIAYVPATTNNLYSLETQVFTRTLGKTVASLIKCATEKWSFQPDNILIPVVAMSTIDDDPSYLFCL